MIQDKGLQKDFFVTHGIPTSPFIKIADRKELEQHAGKFPAVQKLRKSGYDGRGVFMINSTDDLPRSEEQTSELQSLMRTSTAIFCLHKKHNKTKNNKI